MKTIIINDKILTNKQDDYYEIFEEFQNYLFSSIEEEKELKEIIIRVGEKIQNNLSKYMDSDYMNCQKKECDIVKLKITQSINLQYSEGENTEGDLFINPSIGSIVFQFPEKDLEIEIYSDYYEKGIEVYVESPEFSHTLISEEWIEDLLQELFYNDFSEVYCLESSILEVLGSLFEELKSDFEEVNKLVGNLTYDYLHNKFSSNN